MANTYNLKIEGMMCDGCSSSVREALEDLGATAASADHETASAQATFEAPVTQEALAEAIDDAGFKLVEVVEG